MLTPLDRPLPGDGRHITSVRLVGRELDGGTSEGSPTLHERLASLHLEIADIIHEAVTAPRAEIELAAVDPLHARLGRDLETLLVSMRQARHVFDRLLEAMSPERRRANLQAIAMLSRSHDEAARDLQEARLGLEEGSAVAVRVRLARAFHAIGHAEQMHYYLRTDRRPASATG